MIRNLTLYGSAALVAMLVGWAYVHERKKLRDKVAPLADALTPSELIAELRLLAEQGGTVTYDEWKAPLSEAAAYRARKDGLIVSGPTNDAPSDSSEYMSLTDKGWSFLYLAAHSSDGLASGTSVLPKRLASRKP